MKMIRSMNSSGSLLIFEKNSWTFVADLQWEKFQPNSIGSPSNVSKALSSGELLNHVILSSHVMFDRGSSDVNEFQWNGQ